MFDIMVACQEISNADVARFRHSIAVAPAVTDTTAVAVPVAGTAAIAVSPAGFEVAVVEPSSESAVAGSPPQLRIGAPKTP